VNVVSLPASARTHGRVPGEALTKWAVTVIAGPIAAMTFAFSLGNVTMLRLTLGITTPLHGWSGAAGNLSVVGLPTPVRILCCLTSGNRQPYLAAMERPFNGGVIVKAHVSRATAKVGTSNRVQVPGPLATPTSPWRPGPGPNVTESTIVECSMNRSQDGDIPRPGRAGLSDRFVWPGWTRTD
jgi:hypothetical protein